MTNTPLAFVVTQAYVSIGYYVLGAIAALGAVPPPLELQGRAARPQPWNVFWRITFPLARLGFAVALSLAWVRALTEFGAVMVTAYYPAGMPVALWTRLENFGLPAVMPLLVVFLDHRAPAAVARTSAGATRIGAVLDARVVKRRKRFAVDVALRSRRAKPAGCSALRAPGRARRWRALRAPRRPTTAASASTN